MSYISLSTVITDYQEAASIPADIAAATASLDQLLTDLHNADVTQGQNNYAALVKDLEGTSFQNLFSTLSQLSGLNGSFASSIISLESQMNTALTSVANIPIIVTVDGATFDPASLDLSKFGGTGTEPLTLGALAHYIQQGYGDTADTVTFYNNGLEFTGTLNQFLSGQFSLNVGPATVSVQCSLSDPGIANDQLTNILDTLNAL